MASQLWNWIFARHARKTRAGGKLKAAAQDLGPGPASARAADALMGPAALAVQITKICAEGGAPELAEALLREGVTLDQARERIDMASRIKSMVEAAQRVQPALDPGLAVAFIASGASIKYVADYLTNAIVDLQSPEIVNARLAPREATEPAATWDAALKRADHVDG